MKNNKGLLLAWIIALGFIAFGVLANWYLVFVWSAEPTAPVSINPYQQLYDDLLYPSVRITSSDAIGSGVIIETPSPFPSRGGEGLGEGFYILTAAHVVGNEAVVSVELFGSAESLPAFVVATDTGKDLALLRLVLSNNQQLTTKIYPTRLAPRSYVAYIFTPVWVIGCSLGYSPRPSEGTITALQCFNVETLKQCNNETSVYWEVNAPIWPGNSGGGVFLKDTRLSGGQAHELIGIAVWVKICQGQLASTMGGIVPLQTIYEFLEGTKAAKGDEIYE